MWSDGFSQWLLTNPVIPFCSFRQLMWMLQNFIFSDCVNSAAACVKFRVDKLSDILNDSVVCKGPKINMSLEDFFLILVTETLMIIVSKIFLCKGDYWWSFIVGNFILLKYQNILFVYSRQWIISTVNNMNSIFFFWWCFEFLPIYVSLRGKTNRGLLVWTIY